MTTDIELSFRICISRADIPKAVEVLHELTVLATDKEIKRL